jgi:hypothetical protein
MLNTYLLYLYTCIDWVNLWLIVPEFNHLQVALPSLAVKGFRVAPQIPRFDPSRGRIFMLGYKNPLAVPHPLSGYDVLCLTLRLDRCRVDG